MKLSTEGDAYTYILENRSQQPAKVPVHHLSVIADGADPSKVFSEEWHVHHIDGNQWNNSPNNLKLKTASDHVRDHMIEMRGLDLPMDKVIDMYVNQKKSTTELGEIFDCSPESISNYLRKKGIEIRSGGAITEEKPWHNPDNIRDLYFDQQMSATEISNKWDCSPKTIYNYMDKFEIERRNLSEATKLE